MFAHLGLPSMEGVSTGAAMWPAGTVNLVWQLVGNSFLSALLMNGLFCEGCKSEPGSCLMRFLYSKEKMILFPLLLPYSHILVPSASRGGAPVGRDDAVLDVLLLRFSRGL